MSDTPDQGLPADGDETPPPDGGEEPEEPTEPDEPTDPGEPDPGEPGEGMPEALAADPVLTNAIDVPNLGRAVDAGAADAISSAQEAAKVAES